MKYCINYTTKFNYFDSDDVEIEIRYSKEKQNGLLDFCKNVIREDQMLVVRIEDNIDAEELETFKAAAAVHPNIIFKTWNLEDFRVTDLKFMFADTVRCFTDLRAIVSIGVKRVIIGGDLCFNLHRVREYCDPYEVEIVCYANYIENRADNIPCYEKFFIRPEDVYTYEGYIDVLQFKKDDYYDSLQSQNLFYRIYKAGKWDGTIDQIIEGYTLKTPNSSVIPYFGIVRTNCKNDCNECQICSHAATTANLLKENNIVVRVEKKDAD